MNARDSTAGLDYAADPAIAPRPTGSSRRADQYSNANRGREMLPRAMPPSVATGGFVFGNVVSIC
jgi:hypothetical protein